MIKKFAQVAVENTVYHFDKPFTYLLPKHFCSAAAPGMRIMVPFGAGNRNRVAMILKISDEPQQEDLSKLKEASSILDKEPVLSAEQIDLSFWLKERYFCTLFEAVKLMIPAGMNYKLKNSYVLSEEFKNFDREAYTDIQWRLITLLKGSARAVSLEKIGNEIGITEDSPDMQELLSGGAIQKVNIASAKIGDAVAKMVRPVSDFSEKLTVRQQTVYQTLLDVGVVSEKELLYYTGASSAVLKALSKKGAVEIFEYEVYRRPKASEFSEEESEIKTVLSPDQKKVFENLKKEFCKDVGACALLYGVTGSGKTSVFMELINHAREFGFGVIVMVPEISLTAQTINIFTKVFGDTIAVFHSGLSLGERLDEWKRVKRGEAKIVIGTRSAVFAPVQNLGLIVMDEEQEHTYKSEAAPRYDAREVARWRCAKKKALCLLCSATPSVESAFAAQQKRFSFHQLHARFGTATIPNVELVDLNEDSQHEGEILIGRHLKNALIENYENRYQSIILLNRRGYHTFASCKSCKEVLSCPHCSISMTYHNANNRLMCHYCGYSVPFSVKCPTCKENTVDFRGVGTQRIEEELAYMVPGARILRIDTDSVSAKLSLERKLKAFSCGEYDIMIGTQMVAKGLDFENVTLVGVVSADQMLYNDDFRSNERTFDLLTQVVGRAGRGRYEGCAVIQTYMPENPYLLLAAEQDYFGFYKREITYRKAMLYPPFADIFVVGFVGAKESGVKTAADDFIRKLSLLAQNDYPQIPLRVLRAAPAVIAKISNKYRYRIILKCKNTKTFREMMHKMLVDFAKIREHQHITVYADSNPYTIL